jgi:hypothetical protein
MAGAEGQVKAALAVLGLVACGKMPQPNDLLAGYATVGQRGLAGFSWADDDPGLDRPLASGGAMAALVMAVRAGAVGQVRSSDERVFTVDAQALGRAFAVQLTSGHAGSAYLVLEDARGAELDRVAVTVADAEQLVVQGSWMAEGPTVLAGSPVTLTVTPSAGGRVLAGRGAVRFAVAGDLSALPTVEPDAQPFAGRLEGAMRGAGVLLADCAGAHVEVPVAVVAPAALTALTISDTQLSLQPGETANVDLSALAGDQPVYGVGCVWAVDPAGLQVGLDDLDGGEPNDPAEPAPLDADPVITYHVAGPPGHYTATCTAGPLAAVLVVDAS